MQNYSQHFGKDHDFTCPIDPMVYICNAKDSAIFPVSSQINFKIGPVTSTATIKFTGWCNDVLKAQCFESLCANLHTNLTGELE